MQHVVPRHAVRVVGAPMCVCECGSIQFGSVPKAAAPSSIRVKLGELLFQMVLAVLAVLVVVIVTIVRKRNFFWPLLFCLLKMLTTMSMMMTTLMMMMMMMLMVRPSFTPPLE